MQDLDSIVVSENLKGMYLAEKFRLLVYKPTSMKLGTD